MHMYITVAYSKKSFENTVSSNDLAEFEGSVITQRLITGNSKNSASLLKCISDNT